MIKTSFTNNAADRDFMSVVMKTLSSDKSVQINEKLEPHQEDEVDYWDHERPEHTQHAIDTTFGEKSRVEYPLVSRGDETPHPDVEEHLNKNGFHITDYVAGKAKDKYNRETNIGKALTKTKADDHIKSAFDNDPNRQQKSKGSLKVVISHHPYDVAGMTSGHQSWVEQSCMNFDSGAYRNTLPDDVREGTHVAYLTDSEDHNLDRPVARIAIKPFHSTSGHTIFRPEQKVYGNAASSFQHSVNSWCENNYPAREDTTYVKNSRVYDDTGSQTYSAMSKESAEHKIDNGMKIRDALPQHIVSHIADHLIKKQKENPESETLNDYAKTGHSIAFTREQTNALYKVAKDHNQSSMTWTIATQSGNTLNKSNLQHAIANHATATSLLRHKYLPSEFVDTLPTNQLGYIHPNNLKEHHIDKIVDSYLNNESGSSYTVRDVKDHLTSNHLQKIASGRVKTGANGNSYVDSGDITLVAGHKNATPEVMKSLFNSVKSSPDGMKVFNKVNQNPTPEHVAATTDTGSLSHIMSNAKDKLTHNLAFHKAMDISLNDPTKHHSTRVQLGGANSEKYLGDKDIEHMYNNLDNVNTFSLPNGIHDRMLKHSMTKINETHEKLHPSDMFNEPESGYKGHNNPHWSKAYDENQSHFDKHAELISDKISSMQDNLRSDEKVDEAYLDQLDDHIHEARNHDGHEGSHDEVRSEHDDLNHEISMRHDNNY